MAISDMYNRTVVLLASTFVINSYGEKTYTYTSSVNINCALQGRSGNNSVVSDQRRIRANYRMYCSSTESIYDGDKIKISTSVYDILWINKNLRDNHFQIDLEIGDSDRT